MTKRTSDFRDLAMLRLVAVTPLLLLIAATAGAEPYAVGDHLAPIALQDQHGALQHVDGSVEAIVFSRNMDAGKVVREALKDVEADALKSLGAVYVADISGMPGLVAKLFAVPSMRKRPYPMLLDRDGEATTRFPDGGERATLIRCNGLEVTHVLFFDDPVDLHNELGLAAD